MKLSQNGVFGPFSAHFRHILDILKLESLNEKYTESAWICVIWGQFRHFLRVLIISESEYIELEIYSQTREYTPFQEDFGDFRKMCIYIWVLPCRLYIVILRCMCVCVCVLVHSLGSHQSIVM